MRYIAPIFVALILPAVCFGQATQPADVLVVKVTKAEKTDAGIRLSLSIQNVSGKGIAASKGIVTFLDRFGDKAGEFDLVMDQPIKAGDTVARNEMKRLNPRLIELLQSQPETVRVTYKPQKVAYD